jgi:redox-sensitive bicupin YhaK (pirin superfamily)
MPVSVLLKPHLRDLGGGFMVRRLLPAAPQQGVGPFVFFDHFGPTVSPPGNDHDVRPHPHIGLATVTYLFEGAMVHRDSLGSVQRIEPGAINWMTAGRGIVHSERSPQELRPVSRTTHGVQLWAALPKPKEETEPLFAHTPADALPCFSDRGVTARLLIGSLFGLRSPVATFAPTLYLDVAAQAGSTLTLPGMPLERAVYSVDQALVVDDGPVEALTLAVLAPEREARIHAPQGARYLVLGGEAVDGHRVMWWNFVSSSRDRIEQAKLDWTAQRMGHIPGETEWIPLPP